MAPVMRKPAALAARGIASRSEEHTSELQSHSDLVCRILLEKKNALEGKSGLYFNVLRKTKADPQAYDAAALSRLKTLSLSFFFNYTATTEIYTLSLHDALPI